MDVHLEVLSVERKGPQAQTSREPDCHLLDAPHGAAGAAGHDVTNNSWRRGGVVD